uniref:Uncharacterized protein n=1 Tax=Romanomermis culicivorax TaxID=13658 RepID=A0A915HMF6_ROMCU
MQKVLEMLKLTFLLKRSTKEQFSECCLRFCYNKNSFLTKPPPATNPTQIAPLPMVKVQLLIPATCASGSAVSQILLPSTATHANTDPTVTCTNSSDSFINIDPPLAPSTTRAPTNDHCSRLAIANASEIHNFRLEACNVLQQLNTAAAWITNNVPMVQTIDQIIGPVFNQFQAQQLGVQCKIQEQVQATNAHFAALAEQMQQLISTTTALPVARNNPPHLDHCA